MSVALALATAPALAFAYIDPGILGALFQSMYVAIFGFLAAWVFKPWQYIKSWLRIKKHPEKSDENAEIPPKQQND